MFAAMMDRIKTDTLDRLFHVQAVKGEAPPAAAPRPAAPVRMTLNRGDEPVTPRTVHREHEKVGRNDPCPCGSGKKYKKCHGR
jgi:preprotein translocase subunit SecA